MPLPAQLVASCSTLAWASLASLASLLLTRAALFLGSSSTMAASWRLLAQCPPLLAPRSSMRWSLPKKRVGRMLRCMRSPSRPPTTSRMKQLRRERREGPRSLLRCRLSPLGAAALAAVC